MKNLKISVIVAVYNSRDLLENFFRSLLAQKYPVYEYFFVDNRSTDNSYKLLLKFKHLHRNLSIRVIRRKKNLGVASSFNLGAKFARGDYIVTMHSDSLLPTSEELGLLVSPVESDGSVIASGPVVLHPKEYWRKYNFWQKCLFASVVDKRIASGNGKFDCYDRKTFLELGGYDEKHFNNDFGSEDADMFLRLSKIGKVVSSAASVVHSHPVDESYSLKNLITRRRFMAVTYGRHLQLHLGDRRPELMLFFVKPILVICSFIGLVNPFFFIPIIIFPFAYMALMFSDESTFRDLRILILPVVIIYLVYYETYWMFKSMFFMNAKMKKN